MLEIGSYDVNGNVRTLFPTAGHYVGVDFVAGLGVDVVAFGHQLDHDDDSYDLIISAECFERDQHSAETFANMVRMARPGELVAFSCASRGRPEHGTAHADETPVAGHSGGRPGLLSEPERERLRGDVAAAGDVRRVPVLVPANHFDRYFAGIKAGSYGAGVSVSLPDDAAVKRLKSLMPFPDKAVRAPLRALSRLLPEPRFQSVILPYWNLFLRLVAATSPLPEGATDWDSATLEGSPSSR